MRASLEQLTQQFIKLTALTSSNSQLLRDYHEAIRSSQLLRKERRHLQHVVANWQLVMDQLAMRLEDHPQVSLPIPSRQLQDPVETASLQFTQLSESGMQQVIRRCSVNLRVREQQLCLEAVPLLPASDKTMNFGWSIICDLANSSDVFVSMTKRFPGVTAQQTMACTWETTAPHSQTRVIGQEVVQVVPRRAFVEVRDMPMGGQFESKKLRSCLMTFLVETERGYAIGVGSVAPEQRPITARIEDFVEHSCWIELADDLDGCCIATVTYRGQYDSGNTPHGRFVNLFSSVREWEDFVMGHPLKIVDI